MMCSSFITKLKFGQGNVFTHVCHSVHRGGGGSLYHVTPFLVTWSYVPSREGVSVPGPMYLLGGLCSWCHVHSRGSISSVQGVSVRRPSESEKRTVHILLECFLASVYFCINVRTNCEISVWQQTPWWICILSWCDWLSTLIKLHRQVYFEIIH